MHVGESVHEPLEIPDHRADLGLLQHDFGHPDSISVAGALPGQVMTAMLTLPGGQFAGKFGRVFAHKRILSAGLTVLREFGTMIRRPSCDATGLPSTMLAFVLRRLAQAVLVMLAVGLIAFALFRFVGDPVLFMLGQDATPEDRVRVTQQLGLDQPFYIQYARFVERALHGEFGLSLRQVRPVKSLLVERLPATLELCFVAALFALAAGIPMGVYTALRRNSWLSHLMLAVSLIGVSLPTFLIGILLIVFFAVYLGWLPSFGRGDTVMLGWWSTGFLTASGLKALILPAITLGLFQMTLIQRLVRSEMLEVLRTDYIRFARARGLTDRAVHFGHALKNTLVPVMTITGLQLGAIIAFSIITEQVFQWPGMGLLFIQAIGFADVPVMAAYLCLIGLFFVIINLVVDLLYYAVDPRLRIQPI